jgi:hypothetical protein
VAIACIVAGAFAACSREAPVQSPAAEAVYTLKDSTAAGSAVLRRNDEVVDTVDVAFGVQRVGNDSVIFLPIDPPRHVLYDGATRARTDIRTIVPDFDDRFSAPAVIDGALLYWGIHRGATAAGDSIRAVRYEFARKRLNPLPVSPARLDTARGRFYFTPPFRDNKEIVFRAPTGEWRFRTPKQ